MIGIGAIAMATSAMVALAPAAAMAGSGNAYGVSNSSASAVVTQGAVNVAPQAVNVYPSAGSTIVGSVGFIDGKQVGYFWSATRGDSVTETFSGPGRVKKAIFKQVVVSNKLNNGAQVDWTVSINGTDVCSFVVVEGQRGAFTKKCTFPKITGGSYTVMMRVTNEVAGGEGSMSFRYAGTGPHSVNLKRK